MFHFTMTSSLFFKSKYCNSQKLNRYTQRGGQRGFGGTKYKIHQSMFNDKLQIFRKGAPTVAFQMDSLNIQNQRCASSISACGRKANEQ